MKLLGLLSFFLAFSAEVRGVASETHQKKPTPHIMSCKDSWIQKNQLISGCHWVQGSEKDFIETEYGDVLARNGDFSIRKEDGRVYVVNHLGEVKVNLKDGRSVQVPPGFEFWFSELDQDKKNQISLLSPVEMSEHLPRLNSMWTGSPDEFKHKIETYKSRWGDRTEMAAQFYQSLALRKLASIKAEEESLLKKKQAERQRREANRKFMFERVFGR